MTDPAISILEGYRKTRMRRLWALDGCPECRGSGEYLVNDRDDSLAQRVPGDDDVWYPQPCDCLWSPPPEVLRALDAADVRVRRHRERMRDVFDAIGPREVGGTYWDGYWFHWYLVERIDIRFRFGDLAEPSWSIIVRWDSGERAAHRTPWDHGRDGSPSVPRPPGPAPPPPELRYDHFCRWCRSRFALVRAVHPVLSRLKDKPDVRCCPAWVR